MIRTLLILVLTAFGAYSSYVMLQVGYFGIWEAGLANPAAMQVLLDLCIVATLASVWIFNDSRRTQRNPWPYLFITLAAGSFGPLLYLLVGEFSRENLGQGSLA